jgi:outer membrane protein OmpA-like peptidoglycan-associated protein
MAHANISLKFKLNNGYMISEDSRLAPYLFGGIGVTKFTGDRINNNIDYPFVGGAGIRLRFSEILSFNYQATFGYMSSAHGNPASTVAIAAGNDKFLLHTIGLDLNLGKAKDDDNDGVADRKDKCTGTPKGVKVDENGCPFDADKDGVMDYQDNCPNVFGDVLLKGCPDTDKDGIADKDDQCPNDAGSLATNGCPDTDGDGIIDSKDKCPNLKGSLAADGCPDKDGDGIVDKDDMCPDVKGVPSFKGCPDTDGDGIEDTKDMCPDVKGPLTTNGCPDTDNDGVNDGIDKCPTVAGSAAHFGCPDTDNDGVFDDIDNCKTIPGTPANNGCPELTKETKQLFEKALQGIQFETGKAIIKPVSFPILNAIVKVMKDNESYKLMIGGHTDNVGDDAMNMTLSQDRATSVSNYLITHGVDPMRVSATGYGESKPVDTNDSVKGRTRNRRVEFKVEFLK